MSIKLFGKGLGIFDHPFDVSTPVKVDVTDRPTGFISDTTVKPVGQLNQPQTVTDLLTVKPLIQLDTLQSTVQIPTKDIRKNFDILPLPRPIVNTGIKPQLYSAESGLAPFETLFHDFEIDAFPFYNFWTPDELTNDKDERGDRKFEDLPRYIKIVWNIAPDLPDPHERVRPKMVDKRSIRDVMFSREIERPKVFSQRGVSFTPDHLQPAGFSKNKSIIANGHLAPGVLETVVDMPLHNTGIESPEVFSGRDQISQFDEDAFLTNPDLAGVSVHELKAQVQQVTNGIANMASIAPGGVSADLRSQKSSLVDGKFMIKKSTTPGGMGQIAGIHPSSPSLTFEPRLAMPAKMVPQDRVMEVASLVTQPASTTNLQASAQVKVKFFNPAIGGLVQPAKVNLMSAPHHVEAMASIATHLPSLEILSRTNLYEKPRSFDIPFLPSPKVKPLEYVGYVLEKYRRQQSGAFVKVDEIDIPARDADYYIDTKILYGSSYRYRIRAMLRWTRPLDQNIKGKDPLILKRNATHTTPLATHKSSYFYSEWGHTWAYAACIDDQPPPPPDELTVRPDSGRQQITVTFRLPDNPQKDILSMRLYRKFQDEDGNDISKWQQITESDATNRGIDFAPQNVIYIDRTAGFFQDEKLKRVYCAQTISRHGEDSFLSEQLVARLNKDYSTYGEFPVEFLSSAGVRLEYFGAFSSIPNRITKTEIVVVPPPTRVGAAPGSATVTFTGRDTLGNVTLDNGQYICRVQSLDTGEVEDIPFTVNLKNLPVRQDVSKIDFYVPLHTTVGKNSDQYKKTLPTDKRNDLKKLSNGSLDPKRNIKVEAKVYDQRGPKLRPLK